jgi:hypothetical protein
MRWVRHVEHMEAVRNAYKMLVGKPERMRPLGSYRRKSVNNTKLDLNGTGCQDVNQI